MGAFGWLVFELVRKEEEIVMLYNFETNSELVVCPNCGQLQEVEVEFMYDRAGTVVGVEVYPGQECISCHRVIDIELPSNTERKRRREIPS